jgi:hypothetical protein
MGEEEAIVQAVGAADPEFDLRCVQMEAAPVAGPGNLAGMGFAEALEFRFELFAAFEGAALIGDGSADLAGAGAAVEVGVGVGCVEFRYGSFDAYLTAQGLPMKAEGGAWIFGDLVAFSAFCVGEEAETAIAESLGSLF